MTAGATLVAKELIAATLSMPRTLEVVISARVAETLKRKKHGLFQNEVNYNSLFPSFKPSTHSDAVTTRDRYMADLVGFTNGGFVLTEFKLYDERKIETSRPWAALYSFCQDRRKLEAAIKVNQHRHPGVAQLVFAIRNSEHVKDEAGAKVMAEAFLKPEAERNKSRLPSVPNHTLFRVLDAFRFHAQKDAAVKWRFSLVKKGTTAFLIGSTSL